MDPYLGTILPFAGNYAPEGYHLCDGTLLSISGNEALFSLFGTTYGGDGVNNFGIPDLRSRIPVGTNMGGVTPPGVDNYPLGYKGGQTAVTLTSANLPTHIHTAPIATPATGTYKVSSATTGLVTSPAGAKLATAPANYSTYTPNAATAPIATTAVNFTVPVANAGTTQSVTTVPPYVAINFIVAVQGLYPQRAS